MSEHLNLLLLPEVALENIFSFLTFDEIAKNRIVCRKFNQIGGKLLSRGFIRLEKRNAAILKKVKSSLPRRESERRAHPLSRHHEILQSIDTRLNMLNMTYLRYIKSHRVCFIPGKVLDEAKNILDQVQFNKLPVKSTQQILQELRDLSSMAIEHFDEQILPTCYAKSESEAAEEVNLLKELEVITDPFTLNTRFNNKRVISMNVLTINAEIKKLKKSTKDYKKDIVALTQNQQQITVKLRRQNNKIRVQETKLKEQERKIQEQNGKIIEQEKELIEIKKHVDDWDQRFKSFTSELIRARDEIFSKNNSSDNAEEFPTNIKARVAKITLPLSKNYTNFERKRKFPGLNNVGAEIPPVKKNLKDTDLLEWNIPSLENFNNVPKKAEENHHLISKSRKRKNNEELNFNI